MNEHERGFTTFLAEPGQRRMRTLLELGLKKRDKVRALLDHSVSLDPRYTQELRTGAADALLRHGAPKTCFVISGDDTLDGREMALEEALNAVGYPYGGFISCIPAKLGLYVYENGNPTYLLKRQT
jgi:hypothetical protein